eukprot:jgi/Undpi1/13411/HiC_scaffold_8.g03070.m1
MFPGEAAGGALRRSSRLLAADSVVLLESPNTRPNDDNFLNKQPQQNQQHQLQQQQQQQLQKQEQQQQQQRHHHHQLHQQPHQHHYQHEQQQQQQQERQQQQEQELSAPRTAIRPSKKRSTVVGTVCRLLSRSRPATATSSSTAAAAAKAAATTRRAPSSAATTAPTPPPKSPRSSSRMLFPNKQLSHRPRSLSPVYASTGSAGSAPLGVGGCNNNSSNNHNRPRSDQVENFHRALDNELVRLAFGDFCTKTLTSENVEFVRQVRELDQLSRDDDATAAELREKLGQMADAFVRPESATEVNVKGSTREDVLDCIQAALDAGAKGTGNSNGCSSRCGITGNGNNACGSRCEGGGESPWAWVLAVEATEALVGLAREVHPVIFNGIWPRFLLSEEFAVMMNAQEMRTVGFTDLDGKLIIGQMPSPQSRRLPAKKKKELPSAFSRPARAGGAGVGMDVSPVPSSASNNSSVDSSVDVVEAAAAAFAGSGGSATSSVRPASAHRHCRTSFRARPVSHQGNNNGYSRAGIAFAGLPARWGRGSRKDARARPSPPSANGTTSASTSAGVSPTKGEFENRTSSATRRAFSLR